MEQPLTHYQTLALQEVVVVGGDVLLLPEQHPAPYEEVRALREGRTVAVDESILVEAAENFFPLSNEYRAYRGKTGREPSWINGKPVSVRTRLRLDYALMDEDALFIFGIYPHTGLSYMVRDDGFCSEVFQTFKLWRLHGVLQLGFLQAPWFPEMLHSQPVGLHDRLTHSFDVMLMATLIGRNIGLPEPEFNTLRMAALTHDMGTPAGGDSVKLIDLPAFDEDLNYPRLLAQFDWSALKEKYQIDEKVLVETILNRGLLGQILDIADKLAYVARDMHACRPYLEFGAEHHEQHGLQTLLRHLTRYPNVCGLWDSVREVDGQMVIMDAARLGAFLKARTLMFRELYFHPNARFGEYLVSRVLVKALYDAGTLTRDQLLNMRDDELRTVLDQEYGQGRNLAQKSIVEDITLAGAQRKTFHDPAEGQAFLEELRRQGNPFALLENNLKAIKTGTHFKVPTPDGPQPFAAAYPGDTQELEEMAMLFPSVHVYYLERPPNIPADKLEQLANAFMAAAP